MTYKDPRDPPVCLLLSLWPPSLQRIVCQNTRSTHTYLHRWAQRSVLLHPVKGSRRSTERSVWLLLKGFAAFGAQWVKDLSRRWMRAIVTNSPSSDNKVRSLNTTRSYRPASAPPQSLCFVCWAVPVVITLICEVLKSSQSRFVYFLRQSQNILWNVCHQARDAADNSGSARISLWNSCN